jgi:hypothetical protein
MLRYRYPPGRLALFLNATWHQPPLTFCIKIGSLKFCIASVSLLEEFSNEKNAVKKTARKLAFSSTV